jgi:hypothetical protein
MAVTYFVVKRRDGTYDVLSEDTSTQEARVKLRTCKASLRKMLKTTSSDTTNGKAIGDK